MRQLAATTKEFDDWPGAVQIDVGGLDHLATSASYIGGIKQSAHDAQFLDEFLLVRRSSGFSGATLRRSSQRWIKQVYLVLCIDQV